MVPPSLAVSVTALSVTVVKGTRLRTVESVELRRDGALGDRQFYVIDERGRMVNSKTLGDLQASRRGLGFEETSELTLSFPDGAVVSGVVGDGEPVATRFYSIHRDATLVDGPWSEALSGFVGQPVRLVYAGNGVDRGPDGGASLISSASLARLAAKAGVDSVDARRFRMLIEVDGLSEHEEDGWVGRSVAIGDAVVRFGGHVGRCLITSRDPETGVIDLPTLDLFGDYRHHLYSTEPLPFGIYGAVVREGVVRLGDEVAMPLRPVSEDRVRIELQDHVAVATMVRTDKHNALDVEMFDAIIGAAERVGSATGVRAVVLHGEGPSFCSGLDVASIMSAQSNGHGLTAELAGDQVPNWFQRTAYDWLLVPVPVIAAIHGSCLGGGLQIALAADIRIAAPDSRLSVMEIKWGLIPDMAITRTLPRLVGIDVAKELTYTGRVFSGSEAATGSGL